MLNVKWTGLRSQGDRPQGLSGVTLTVLLEEERPAAGSTIPWVRFPVLSCDQLPQVLPFMMLVCSKPFLLSVTFVRELCCSSKSS